MQSHGLTQSHMQLRTSSYPSSHALPWCARTFVHKCPTMCVVMSCTVRRTPPSPPPPSPRPWPWHRHRDWRVVQRLQPAVPSRQAAHRHRRSVLRSPARRHMATLGISLHVSTVIRSCTHACLHACVRVTMYAYTGRIHTCACMCVCMCVCVCACRVQVFPTTHATTTVLRPLRPQPLQVQSTTTVSCLELASSLSVWVASEDCLVHGKHLRRTLSSCDE